MRATCVVNAGVLKTLLKGLNILVSESRWRFSESGLQIRAVDPANVSMVIANIEPHVFDAYQINEKEVIIGVDIDRLFDFVKSFRKDDLVDITILDSKINIKARSIEYSLSLIDPSAIRREPKIPEIELPAKIVMTVENFKQALNAANKFSDYVILETSDSGLKLQADGDIDKITAYFRDSEVIEFNGAKAKSMFGIDYLMQFFSVPDKNSVVTLRLGDNYPLHLTFEIQDGFTLEYFQAPRIEVE